MEVKYQCPFCKNPEAVFRTEFWELQMTTTWFDTEGSVEETKDSEIGGSGPLPHYNTKCMECGGQGPIEKFVIGNKALDLVPVSLNTLSIRVILGYLFFRISERFWPWSRMPR